MSFKLNKIILVFIFLTIFLSLVFSETILIPPFELGECDESLILVMHCSITEYELLSNQSSNWCTSRIGAWPNFSTRYVNLNKINSTEYVSEIIRTYSRVPSQGPEIQPFDTFFTLIRSGPIAVDCLGESNKAKFYSWKIEQHQKRLSDGYENSWVVRASTYLGDCPITRFSYAPAFIEDEYSRYSGNAYIDVIPKYLNYNKLNIIRNYGGFPIESEQAGNYICPSLITPGRESYAYIQKIDQWAVWPKFNWDLSVCKKFDFDCGNETGGNELNPGDDFGIFDPIPDCDPVCEEDEICRDGICIPDPGVCGSDQDECGDGTCCDIGGCDLRRSCVGTECVLSTVTTCNPTSECELNSDDCVIPDPILGGVCGDRAKDYSYSTQTWPVDSVYCLRGEASSTPSFPEAGEIVSWICVNNGINSPNCIARRLSKDDFFQRPPNIVNSILDFSATYINGKLNLFTQCLIKDSGILSSPSEEINEEQINCNTIKELVKIKEIEIKQGLIELNFKIDEPCLVCQRTIYLNIKNQSAQDVAIPDFNLILIILIISIITIALKIDKK